MTALTRSDIVANQEYALIRDELRKKIITLKESRRVFVGPYLHFLFENKETMHYQVQEMMRVEGIESEAAIQHEIDTYNELVGKGNELKATLMIEFSDEMTRRVKLKELVGLQDSITFEVDSHVNQAKFDMKQIDTEKLSSVQYVTIPLSKESVEALIAGKSATLKANHPACSYQTALSKEQLSSLVADLSQ